MKNWKISNHQENELTQVSLSVMVKVSGTDLDQSGYSIIQNILYSFKFVTQTFTDVLEHN